MAKLAPEVQAMRDKGMTVPQIALAVKRSERYIRRLLAYYRDNLQGGEMVVSMPDPIPPELLDEEFQEMVSEESPEAFEKFFLKFSGHPYLPEHLKEAIAAAMSNRRLLLNVPPRHAKSEVFSVWFPLWLIVKNRNVQILLVSKTADFARKFTNKISYILTYPGDGTIPSAFGRFKPELVDWPWRPNSGELMVEGRSRDIKPGDLTIQIRGAGQQVLGMEADWIIIDDPTDAEVSNSETKRESLSEWLRGEVLTRLVPGGRAVVVGQRVHLQDIYGELETMKYTRGPMMGNRVWHTIKYPAIIDWGSETQEPQTLWPAVWPYEELMERYESMGYALFECMFQQNPMPLGERMVMPEWIYGSDDRPGCLDRERRVGEGYLDPLVGFLPTVRVLSIDPSPKKFAGIVVADVVQNRENFFCTVLEMDSKRMSMRDTVLEVEDVLRRYGPVDYFIFETSTFSHWLFEDPYFQSLKLRVRVLPHITSAKTKGDPELGIPSMALEFEKGHIRFPYADAESRTMVDEFLERELYTYPQGELDDRLMALWFIKARWRSLIPTKDLPKQTQGVSVRPRVWERFKPQERRPLRITHPAGS